MTYFISAASYFKSKKSTFLCAAYNKVKTLILSTSQREHVIKPCGNACTQTCASSVRFLMSPVVRYSLHKKREREEKSDKSRTKSSACLKMNWQVNLPGWRSTIWEELKHQPALLDHFYVHSTYFHRCGKETPTSFVIFVQCKKTMYYIIFVCIIISLDLTVSSEDCWHTCRTWLWDQSPPLFKVVIFYRLSLLPSPALHYSAH